MIRCNEPLQFNCYIILKKAISVKRDITVRVRNIASEIFSTRDTAAAAAREGTNSTNSTVLYERYYFATPI